MTPESQLAEILGSLPSTQMEKLAEAYSELDIEELQVLLTGGSKEKVAYYSDSNWINQFEGTPYFDRASALETKNLQHEIEENNNRMAEDAKRMKKDKVRENFYRIGDQLRTEKKGLELELALHRHVTGKKAPTNSNALHGDGDPVATEKSASIQDLTSPEDKINMAEIWGRELAHTHFDAIVKEASKEEEDKKEYKRLAKGHGRLGALMGGISGAASRGAAAGFTGMNKKQIAGMGALGAAGGAATGYVSGRVGNWMAGKVAPKGKEKSSAEKSDEYKRMSKGHGRLGAAVGALGGAVGSVAGASTKSKNKALLGLTGLGGAVTGGAIGAGMGKARHWAASKFAPKEEGKEKKSIALPTGLMSGVSKVVQNPAVKGVVGKAAKTLGGASMNKTLGMGALGGAALGAYKQPQPGGSRLGGALRGAAMGAGMAGGAKAGLGMAQASKGGVGSYLRNAAASA